MPSHYYRDLVKLLRAAGWEMLRQGAGSHEIWHHASTGRKVTVPHNCKRRETANAILKAAGIGKKL